MIKGDIRSLDYGSSGDKPQHTVRQNPSLISYVPAQASFLQFVAKESDSNSSFAIRNVLRAPSHGYSRWNWRSSCLAPRPSLTVMISMI